ncbi:sodium/proline symporter [Enteractinococcus coprophilus]|uniref:Sodium/proline symporter n=1 Tax=Enteractinococcus coprophilus TaxID=1027633 RepID=A0A543AGJ2_9MICC|nr:sodium/proline symporter [Enteractinococcus coprophilus]TQL71695.1 SSS family solute:Na+ symporter/sodium/proline symporter [Enteractinococcus coprophilus]
MEQTTGILIILVLYLVLMLGIGIWSAKTSQQGSSDYFLGGNRVGPWVLSMSEKASESSGFMTAGLPGEAHSSGMSAAWNAVSSVFSIFNWVFFAKPLRRLSELLKSLTIPDYLSSRYQDHSHIMRGVSIVMMTVFQTVYICAQFVAFGILFEAVLDMSFVTGVIVGGVVTTLYTMVGGFFAVAITDFIQGLLLAVAFVVLPIVGITKVGGFTQLGNTLTESMGSDFLKPFFDNPTLTFAGLIAIISYLFIGIGFNGAPHVLVRYMALRTTRDVKKIALIGIIWMMIAYYGAVLIGLAGAALFPNIDNPEEIFPLMALELLPWWLAGVIIAAALSALMSSIDSMLLITSSSIAEDLWNKMFYKGKLSQKKTIVVSQISTVVIGVVAILIALNPFDSVFWLAVFAWAGLATCFGPPVILSLYWKGVTKWGAIAGMIVGPVVTILWYFWPPIDIYEGGPAFIAALITIVVVSLLTQAPHDEDFEKMWADYNEKNATGTPSFLASDYAYLKSLQAEEDLQLKSDQHIVRDLLDKKLTVARPFTTVKGSAAFGSAT